MSETRRQSTMPAPRSVPIAALSTTLGRARCPQPAQLARMRQSLSAHGQMTPLVVVERAGTLELVDGFKRRLAAAQMGWQSLCVSVRALDERAQWAAMLTLNRTPGSLSVLEEALILRELVQSGTSQSEIGQMLGRHRSWVCRRLALVERLHPELVEWVRTGLLSPGTARRLTVLPAGNQLELGAVVRRSELSTEQTELLVSLWQKAKDSEVRRFLLAEPRTAIEHASPDRIVTPPDPRLSPRGQTLQRSLRILRAVAARAIDALDPPLLPTDREILESEMERAARTLPALEAALGSASRCDGSGARSETIATHGSGSCSPTAMGSRRPRAKPAST